MYFLSIFIFTLPAILKFQIKTILTAKICFKFDMLCFIAHNVATLEKHFLM